MGASSSNDAAAAVEEEIPRWQQFQNQKHSLRISVSELACCVGYHPYRDLVQLALQHVYQGSAGQELLEHDANLLGLRLEGEQELLMEMVQQAGKATADAWNAVVQVKSGESKVQSVEQAQKMSKAVVDKAKESKKLSKTQIQQLEQASRHGINTGFGTCWEDQALDMYEKKFGCEVRARNEEIKVWPFVADGATARPLKDPYCRFSKHEVAEPEPKRRKSNKTEDGEQLSKEGATNSTSPKFEECFFSLRGAIDGIRDELVPNSSDGDDDSWVLQPIIVECKHRMNRLQASPPLYEMVQVAAYCKMYDAQEGDLLQVLRKRKLRKGIEPKEEAAKEKYVQQKLQFEASSNENKENEEAESNSIPAAKPVIDLVKEGHDVERSKEAQKLDPILGLEETSKDSEKEGVLTETNWDITNGQGDECTKVVEADRESSKIPTLDAQEGDKALNEKAEESDPLPPKANEKTNEVSSKEGSNDVNEDSMMMDILVIRISMEDPRFQLNQNWESMILPRLTSWVDGIYEIRSCDDKRYRLLMASTSSAVGEEASESLSLQQLRDAWSILFEECPWLIDCDTQYNREIGSDRTR